jgi:hypothetical protein
MTSPAALTVALDTRDATSSARQRSVLASLPRRFVIAAEEPADVVVVSGLVANWPDEVIRAVDSGARGVLVVDPGPADPDRVRDAADAAAGRAIVAVETAYATDRTWMAARQEVAADARTASIVDSVVEVPADRPGAARVNALVDQLAVVRPLLGSLDALRLLDRSERRYLLGAPVGGVRVMLAGVASAIGREALSLDVVAAERRWQIRFDETALGRPTDVTVYDRTGARSHPLLYESGRRVAWQRLHDALTGDGAVGYDLNDLSSDLRLARRLLP